jgi:hypothetical protein
MIPATAAVTARATPDPYGVFDRARAVWEQAIYPSYVRYDVVVRVDQNGVPKISHYHSFYDATNDTVHVDGVSDEERAHPHVPPPGFNFNLFGAIPLSKPEEPVDYLGVPELAPNYSFGMAQYVPGRAKDPKELVQEIRRQFHDRPAPVPTAPPAGSGLKIIGSVEATRRDYVVTLDGVERVSGHADYHLTLRPTRDPKKYRLRDLWVDAQTFATDKLVTDGNFTDGPSTGVPWTVAFAHIDGAPIVATETTAASLRLHGRRYTGVSLAFENVTAQSDMPMEIGIQTTTGATLAEPQ